MRRARGPRQPAASAPTPALLEYPVAAPPPPGEAVEIAPGILWLRMPLPFALNHINLWLLADDDGGTTLVDCGYGDAATRALWERHFATTIGARPIRRIIATHCHPDHVGNARWLSERFAAPIAMTHAEFLTAHAIAGQHAGYTPAATLAHFRRHGMAEADLAALERRGNTYRHGVPDLPETFDRLLDGDTRQAGGTAWRVSPSRSRSKVSGSSGTPCRYVLPRLSRAARPDSAMPCRRKWASVAAGEYPACWPAIACAVRNSAWVIAIGAAKRSDSQRALPT
jgi:hypothetical protein